MLTNTVTDSNLNHTGIYLYSKGKIMIHLTFDYQSDEGCTTPGQYLRYHRTFQGLTTRELAEKVGVVPATLVLYENDRHPIKHSTAVALANVLGIDRSRLLDEYTVFVDYPYSSLLKKVRRELSFIPRTASSITTLSMRRAPRLLMSILPSARRWPSMIRA